MAGLEVEGITPLAPDLERVYVGFVQEVQDHPGQKTSRCAPLTWAHRAPIPSSAVPQMWVLGRRCPWPWKEQCCRGLAIRPTEIRGVLSQGMICSQAELGISDDHAGIWVLPLSLPPASPWWKLWDWTM